MRHGIISKIKYYFLPLVVGMICGTLTNYMLSMLLNAVLSVKILAIYQLSGNTFGQPKIQDLEYQIFQLSFKLSDISLGQISLVRSGFPNKGQQSLRREGD